MTKTDVALRKLVHDLRAQIQITTGYADLIAREASATHKNRIDASAGRPGAGRGRPAG